MVGHPVISHKQPMTMHHINMSENQHYIMKDKGPINESITHKFLQSFSDNP